MPITELSVLAALAVCLTGVLVAVGVWLLESRRRLRQRAGEFENRLRARLDAEPELAGTWIVPVTRTPLVGGPVQLDLIGYTPRPRQRERVLELARAEAAGAWLPVRVNDRLEDTLPEGRRTA